SIKPPTAELRQGANPPAVRMATFLGLFITDSLKLKVKVYRGNALNNPARRLSMSQNFIIVIRNLGSVELAIVLLRAKAASMVHIARFC
ncbi:MAG: hypothetical protein Q8N30_15750, partial [Methylococcales bacterium]|nr:hypothetical protein [Methylococcales bacterium]